MADENIISRSDKRLKKKICENDSVLGRTIPNNPAFLTKERNFTQSPEMPSISLEPLSRRTAGYRSEATPYLKKIVDEIKKRVERPFINYMKWFGTYNIDLGY